MKLNYYTLVYYYSYVHFLFSMQQKSHSGSTMESEQHSMAQSENTQSNYSLTLLRQLYANYVTLCSYSYSYSSIQLQHLPSLTANCCRQLPREQISWRSFYCFSSPEKLFVFYLSCIWKRAYIFAQGNRFSTLQFIQICRQNVCIIYEYRYIFCIIFTLKSLNWYLHANIIFPNYDRMEMYI